MGKKNLGHRKQALKNVIDSKNDTDRVNNFGPRKFSQASEKPASSNNSSNQPLDRTTKCKDNKTDKTTYTHGTGQSRNMNGTITRYIRELRGQDCALL